MLELHDFPLCNISKLMMDNLIYDYFTQEFLIFNKNIDNKINYKKYYLERENRKRKLNNKLQIISPSESIVAMFIIDKFLYECRNFAKCPIYPDYCDEYISKINIQDAKSLKAYFISKEVMRDKKSSFYEMQQDYYMACEHLLGFCYKLKKDTSLAKTCAFYHRMYKILDRRKNIRRTTDIIRISVRSINDANNEKNQLIDKRRSDNDRRNINHLGYFATIFES